MKNKLLHTVFLLLLTTALGFGQQAEKILVKSFSLPGSNLVVLDFSGPVEIRTWNDPTMRVQMTVSLDNGTEAMLKSLITAGRYNLKSAVENGEFRISLPGLDREASVRGVDLEERFSFVVFVPERVAVEILNPLTDPLAATSL